MNLSSTHWQACKRILRYLKSTLDHRLTYKIRGRMELVIFSSANWACDIDDRRSFGGYCVILEIT